jgi:hypothetical protein
MLLEIRDRLKPLDVGKYPLLGGNDSETIFEKNLDKYNNAALIINDYDTSSEPYLVCQKCNNSMFKFCFWIIKWSYFERKEAILCSECIERIQSANIAAFFIIGLFFSFFNKP